MTHDSEDERLIEKIQFGDEKALNAAITELLDKSKGIVAKVVSAGGGKETDVQDILHEAGLDLYILVKKGAFDPQRANWRTLIYTIAKNKWLDKKHKQSKFEHFFPALNMEFNNKTNSYYSPIEEHIFKQEDREKILTSLKQLGPTCREFMKMKYLAGASIRVICEKIGISESAAKQRHKRCKEKLKHIFGKDPRFE